MIEHDPEMESSWCKCSLFDAVPYLHTPILLSQLTFLMSGEERRGPWEIMRTNGNLRNVVTKMRSFLSVRLK